jgi:hypothetical protein
MGVAVDAFGNIYVTGYTYGGLDGNTLVGGADVFLVKYLSDGGKEWTRQLGVAADDLGFGVAADMSGSIYVTGYTMGGLDGNTLVGGADVFLAKYLSDGGKEWTRQLGTTGVDIGVDVAVDTSDGVYLTGYTYGGLDGNTNAGATDMFLVKFLSDGGKVWTRQLGTSANDFGAGVAVSPIEGIYVTGVTLGLLDGVANAGLYDMFLVKFQSDGGKEWTRQLGTGSDDLGYSVATDMSGGVYLAGTSYGGLDGNTSAGATDIVLVKYLSDGGRAWTRQLGTLTNERAHAVAVDADGGIFVTGQTSGGLDGNTPAGLYDMFLVKYDADGGKQ